MSIRCPNCSKEITLAGLSQGHFTPKCPHCKTRFDLTIDADEEASVKKIDLAKRAAAKAAGVDKSTADIFDALGIDIPKPKLKPKPRPAQSNVAKTSVPQSPIARTMMVSQPEEKDSQPRTEPVPALNEATIIKSHAEQPAAEPAEDLSGRLGGYDVVKKLGQGGMGSVYLARQVSLDRNVALKVMNAQWAADPVFVARFAREAFAAAQLTHHNIVQIHDIGEEKSKQFFSMEFVEGQTLAGLQKEKGRIDPNSAVNYVLQAARGLKYAHDHGMVHRDVKPENLLINEEGIVKVADLGLVKTPGSKNDGSKEDVSGKSTSDAGASQTGASQTSVTQMNTSMGTPLYMSPEQATDAAGVDGRADIYSLGCTLYHLLVGRPPFLGNSAAEVIAKHRSEKMVPAEQIIRRVPESLSQIIQKMTAKDVAQRHQNMASVIKDLEGFLGVESGKPFAPAEEHVDDLEREAKVFNEASWAGIRKKLILAFYALSIVGCVAMFVMGSPFIASGMVGFIALTTISYIIVQGMMQRTSLFKKIRQLVLGARILDWLMWIIGLAILGAVLYVLDWHWSWLTFAIVSVGAAVGFYFGIDLLVAKQRSYPVRACQQMIKEFRVKGLDEDGIRAFVAKFAGTHWEELYEALFGYEDKLIARQRWGKGEGGKERPRFAAWRDKVIAWIDHKMESRKQRQQEKYLQKIESRKLKAQGLADVQIKKQAKQTAAKLVHRAEIRREESFQRLAATAAPVVHGKLDESSIQVIKRNEEGDEVHDDEREHLSFIQRRYGGWLGLLTGSQIRFICGAILLAGFTLWLYQNKSIPAQAALERTAEQIGSAHDALSGEAKFKAPEMKKADLTMTPPKKDIELPFVPSSITSMFSNYNAGIAGALLIISCLFTGQKLGLLIIPAAGVIFAGHLIPGMPDLAIVHQYITQEKVNAMPLAAGLVLAVLGFLFIRK